MEDKLKDFINEHREEFDSFEPRPDLWQDISKELPQKKTARVISLTYARMWQYAAAVVLLIAAVFVIRQYIPTNTDGLVTPPTTTASLEKIAPQMAEVERYYTSLINERKTQMGSFDLKSLGVNENLQQDIAGLDSAYARLKTELLTTPNKEQIMDAMIQNLQLRMEILNQQLNTLEEIRKIKQETKHEKVQA
ncbi:hypothetical protein GXP67_20660 [Rhodocytophaga rosea]|uniref:Anti-sigma factor n=1 Tax=Rhodocytophaga rosea TaxID=2704465 RepID=A0A6C0GLJ1_9BACT|nr:hypothetical protein [Rhodocytophaga rosea]QHT68888.1 hypothetical protein GXP67_20660 [Rhodocytophaga rosea]